ncbi:hypothetical protein Y032_0367g23 [Ancylostoma ceylanicum]|uniref:Uncharacterized protein n=1 Tax=Ancylostoma ceylanicum TaxID=53326 RepID=A0A016RUW1_9BILA|nr:hypothetical protein Y032_0367g23 [Ancylostoma ceylanicum]
MAPVICCREVTFALLTQCDSTLFQYGPATILQSRVHLLELTVCVRLLSNELGTASYSSDKARNLAYLLILHSNFAVAFAAPD